MTEKDFKKMIGAFGSNPDKWPTDTKEQALAFAGTDTGRSLLVAEQSLDDILNLAPTPKNADSKLLNALLTLPDNQIKVAHYKENPLKTSFMSQLREQMPEIASWLRPQMLAAQGAALSTALFMGIWVGGQQATAQDAENETDLSYSLLSEDLLLDEDTLLEEATLLEEDLENWNEE